MRQLGSNHTFHLKDLAFFSRNIVHDVTYIFRVFYPSYFSYKSHLSSQLLLQWVTSFMDNPNIFSFECETEKKVRSKVTLRANHTHYYHYNKPVSASLLPPLTFKLIISKFSPSWTVASCLSIHKIWWMCIFFSPPTRYYIFFLLNQCFENRCLFFSQENFSISKKSKPNTSRTKMPSGQFL